MHGRKHHGQSKNTAVKLWQKFLQHISQRLIFVIQNNLLKIKGYRAKNLIEKLKGTCQQTILIEKIRYLSNMWKKCATLIIWEILIKITDLISHLSGWQNLESLALCSIYKATENQTLLEFFIFSVFWIFLHVCFSLQFFSSYFRILIWILIAICLFSIKNMLVFFLLRLC